jgi:SAM-dependent methyltransferase
MESDSLSQQKAQLDKAERDHLEDVVEKLRSRVEDNVRFQLTQKGLDDEPQDKGAQDEDTEKLVEAIDIEGVDGHTWEEAFEKYIAGVGYTIVNRLAALRCMEVRDFIDEEVTVFKENGLTPAAETLVNEEFLLEDEAILSAYQNTCDELADEIEILFDRSSSYSLIDPDDDTFEELCGMLDEIPNEVWRADDVLGWIYEYYNRPVVEALDAKDSLDTDDVGPANQFYTPHWVVRMLADNSLGKLYLEATGQESSIPELKELSPEERKDRSVTPDNAPDIQNLCTYLIPDEGDQDAPSFDHPSELRVIDPACGSGHFLLYAYDILERIWWAETDLDRSEIPEKILRHNLYGVDIDLRSCQLSAFNLYLKARTRAEEENKTDFEMPNLGIVCADARIAEVEDAIDVLDQITGKGTEVRDALSEVIEEFQTIEALGSLLDVQGTLSDEFLEGQTDVMEWGGKGPHTLNEFLCKLEDAVEERTSDSFGEQNLRDFLNLLIVLTQDYDVALMNPPYGSRGRMPRDVKSYVEEHYEYVSEYYINFFEACDRLVKQHGRVGMLVPRSFMFKRIFTDFRLDFVGERGSFDFLAEFGIGVLDNATVRTAGTVVRTGKAMDQMGEFIRLSDLDAAEKETAFLESVFSNQTDSIQRRYEVPISEFSRVPLSPLSYWTPNPVRRLHESELKMDADAAKVDGQSIATAAQGLATGDNDRFLQKLWESNGCPEFIPYAKGGSDAWIMPEVKLTLQWGDDGQKIKRTNASVLRNTEYYGEEGLTWTQSKETGRRFGYFPSGGAFDVKGSMLFPDEIDPWSMMGVLNSSLYHSLFLSLTPERDWQVGDVGRIPWIEDLENLDEIQRLSQEQYSLSLASARSDPTSPYYIAPDLVTDNGVFFYDHTHNGGIEDEPISESKIIDYSISIPELVNKASERSAKRVNRIEEIGDKIDSLIYDDLNISASIREEIELEIEARTSGTPGQKSRDINSSVEQQVKELIHHIALQTVWDAGDGIIPISTVENEPTLAEQVVEQLRSMFGQFANERLVEVDQALGDRSSEQMPYPNIYQFINKELFEFHVKIMDKTPIMWELQTSRLVSDSTGEGFNCLVNYYQIERSVFDRLQNHYLEPRKTLLRERRSSANRRRSDDSLSTSEQAKAAEEYERCKSSLEQISLFEDRLSDLVQSTTRDWPVENQELAESMIEKVVEFRERTASRLETLETLADIEDVNMGSLFSPTFYETVQEKQSEWIEALEDLEVAFEAYAKDGSKTVEPHLYDLFDYYDDLVGSTHYASNGILFMTYYFNKFDDVEQSKIDDGGISKRHRLQSKLANDLDEYIELANEIEDACDELADDIPSDWTDRALSEITNTGYQPNRQHGVVINITPLVESEIVPEIVDKQVI